MDYDSSTYVNTPQVMTPSVLDSSAPPTPLGEDGVAHKSHKSKKKKKKKNKHKKKHKHEKEHGERPRAVDSDSMASPPDFEVI
jgi:hypothetical protein